MAFLWIFLSAFFCLADSSFHDFSSSLTDATRSFIDLCRHSGFIVERHVVCTEDGYLLTLFRIPRMECNETRNTRPVIMQHGLLASSDSFIANDPVNSPAFILVREGYDVWLPNSRGTMHSKLHRDFEVDGEYMQDAFWQYSLEELGAYDNKAVIEYVLAKTGYSKVAYIGHS